MTRQLVKKSRTDKRKRKGYKGTKWDTAKTMGKGAIGTGLVMDGTLLLMFLMLYRLVNTEDVLLEEELVKPHMALVK